jgi:hypothetical protein
MSMTHQLHETEASANLTSIAKYAACIARIDIIPEHRAYLGARIYHRRSPLVPA